MAAAKRRISLFFAASLGEAVVLVPAGVHIPDG
jgi:hypothetical protein